ncbi:MAG: TonB-dependent receptor [Ignavibacteriales bacterium]|nr:TonB-dependent receptor [Ignavibacteriales bacterium]
MMKSFATLLTLWYIGANILFAGSTGKISGKAVDAQTKESVPGVNIILEGTKLGAPTDFDGNYNILNIPPGIYTLRASAIGFHPVTITEVKVSVDLTTRIDVSLTEETIQLNQEVLIVAQRPIVQKDLTSTSSKVSADQIKAFPVEDVAGLVNLQAGVVEGHFRGGRSGEVLYLIDGIPVTDSYSGGAGVSAENQAIQELEVISGTFNAEYGQAMSGVVNQITKDGSEKFSVSLSTYFGDYVSGRDNLFLTPEVVRNGDLSSPVQPTENYNRISPADIFDMQGTISGPIIGSDVTFFLSGRKYSNDGHLYGRRIFNPNDSANFSSNNASQWYRGATGDNEYVSMNDEHRSTVQGKVTVRAFETDKFRFSYLGQTRDWRNYDHRYKYNPDGAYKNFSSGTLASINYVSVLSAETFWEVNAAWYRTKEESYVFEDPYDRRFPVSNQSLQSTGSAFFVRGAEDVHFHRELRNWLGKGDFVSQITNHHQVKAGFEGKLYRLWINNFGIQNDQMSNFKPKPVYFGSSDFANVVLNPIQSSAYLQDKMEYESFIVNIGIRFDYFDSKAKILTEQLKLNRTAGQKAAESEFQMSPRFGLAFPITDQGVLHLSYGHFFQIPQFDLMYLNPSYNINATETFQVGNPGLRSERTVAYELGLQQQVAEDVGIDVTIYYKDVRNLLGTQIFELENGNRYSQYINQDYGNTKGFILSLEKRLMDGFGATIDYTFQIAKGNASDPNSVFLDSQSDPPVESQKQMSSLDWDRRHSFNVSLTFGRPKNYTITTIGRLGSGLPYTPSLQNQRTGLVNSENRPMVYTVDLYATKFITFADYSLSIFAKVYNLFDTENELNVFTDTGRANYSIQAGYSGRPRGINSIEEYYTRPDFYSAPRQIIVGVEINI